MHHLENDVARFLFDHTGPIFDVRSPLEFLGGAIPGSLSLPLFSNQERHEVGLCYKQKGKQEAITLGLSFVGPKLASFSELFCREKSVRILCFRGGMRSGSMAWLASLQCERVVRLEKGYKAYRHWVLEKVDKPIPALVFSGATGSGKTELLRLLQAKNQPVVDLEGLAHHRGSVFGGYEETGQPTQENFENSLAHAFHSLASSEYVCMEAESRAIGRITLPMAVYESIHRAVCLHIECSFEERLQRIMKEYGDKPQELLIQSVLKLERRLGGQRMKEIVALLSHDKKEEAAGLLLEYYDKTYSHCIKKHSGMRIHFSRKEIVDAIEQGTFEEIAHEVLSRGNKSLACHQ